MQKPHTLLTILLKKSAFLLILGVTVAVILLLNSPSLSWAQTNKLRLSLGKRHDDNSIVAFEKLKLGREWSIFELRSGGRVYYGQAEVVGFWKPSGPCSAVGPSGGLLKLKRTQETSFSEHSLYLLVSPQPSNPSNVKIQEINFSKIPQEVRMKVEVHSGARINFYSVDLNSDNLIDLIITWQNIPGLDSSSLADAVIFEKSNSWAIRQTFRYLAGEACG